MMTMLLRAPTRSSLRTSAGFSFRTYVFTLCLLAACARHHDAVRETKALLERADACKDVECARAVRDELHQLGRDVLGALQPLSAQDRDYVFRVAPSYVDWRVTKLIRGGDAAAETPPAAAAPAPAGAADAAAGSAASREQPTRGQSPHARLSRSDAFRTINNLCAVAIASDSARRAHPGSAESLMQHAREYGRRIGVQFGDTPAHTGDAQKDVLAAFDYINAAASDMKNAMRAGYPAEDVAVVEVSRLSCGLLLITTGGVRANPDQIGQLVDAMRDAHIHAEAARTKLAGVFEHGPTLAQERDAFIDFTSALGDAIEHEGSTASAR